MIFRGLACLLRTSVVVSLSLLFLSWLLLLLLVGLELWEKVACCDYNTLHGVTATDQSNLDGFCSLWNSDLEKLGKGAVLLMERSMLMDIRIDKEPLRNLKLISHNLCVEGLLQFITSDVEFCCKYI